ncbi:MAG: hypothetical protein K1X39_08325 [Thermoflexales bacterium]|nr:hypothetical protein [Thermoflexales bacterium]
MYLDWFNSALAALNSADGSPVQRLLNDGQLLFDAQTGIGDAVDGHSARLIVAALRQRERLLVVLPDLSPHRPAFLLAAALVDHLWNSRYSYVEGFNWRRPVLYFGRDVEIRQHLRRVTVRGLELNLAEVFAQGDIKRGAEADEGNHVRDRLPRVLTVFAPADPAAIIRERKPSWIAVDCNDYPSLTWLKPALETAQRQRIPVLAWGQNPLSDSVTEFARYGYVLTWPPAVQKEGRFGGPVTGDAKRLLHYGDVTSLAPIVLRGKNVDEFSGLLQDAYQSLLHASSLPMRHLEMDATKLHWRYLRSLESLAVPLDFYEAEAPRFWGLESLQNLENSCDRFRSELEHGAGDLRADLERVGGLLGKARRALRQVGTPLWDALNNLSIEGSKQKEARVLLFGSTGRKRLFLFAMLARHNITDVDLEGLGTYVLSLAELRKWIRAQADARRTQVEGSLFPASGLNWCPVFVGLPSPATSPRLSGALLCPRLEFVVYPHQRTSLIRRQAQWSIHLTGDISLGAKTLVRMTGVSQLAVEPTMPDRIVVREHIELDIDTAISKTAQTKGQIWTTTDAVSEVARLLETDDPDSDEDGYLDDRATDDSNPPIEPSDSLWCAEAIRIDFDQGWHAVFAVDDLISVWQGSTLSPRYVRSLRIGDRVMLIHGQQRHSMYELIISRVHRHPAIELHLAMIRRWQDDLRVAFRQWQMRPQDVIRQGESEPRDLGGLLRRLQARGSQLVSTMTLNYWLKGYVLCPLNPEDLRRIAEVLDMRFVLQYHRQISKAATRLRGLHRGLSNRLNHWLEDQATGVSNKNDDDVIDDDLGLTFGDVRNSLLFLRVMTIQTVKGPFLRSNLARAEQGGDRD